MTNAPQTFIAHDGQPYRWPPPPGWWQANDGRWYPPAAGRIPPPPPHPSSHLLALQSNQGQQWGPAAAGPELMQPLWRRRWFQIAAGILLLVAMVGALSPDSDGDRVQDVAAPASQAHDEPASLATNTTATATADFAARQWEQTLSDLATGEGSLITKADEAARIGPRLSMDAGTAETELANMVDRLRSGELVSMPAVDEQWALVNIVTARAIEAHYGQSSPRGQFAYDYFQIVRDLYRGTSAPSSDFILANIDQLNRAIDEGL